MAPISKAWRGFEFTVAELDFLLEAVEAGIPIGNSDWEQIWQENLSCYPAKEQNAKLLKPKFLELAGKKKYPLVILTSSLHLCCQVNLR